MCSHSHKPDFSLLLRRRFCDRLAGLEREQAPQDPVWGDPPAPKAGKNPHPCAMLCWSMCPCVVPPWCGPQRKGSWYKLARYSVCFWFLVVECTMMLAMFCYGFAPTKINPMLGPQPEVLNYYGAKNTADIVVKLQLWRLVTPCFLHAGVVHIGMNGLIQFRIGVAKEWDWGTKKFLLIWVVSGVFGNICSAALIPYQISVGASGSLMGVFGAWLVEILAKWNAGSDFDRRKRSIELVIVFVNITIILSMSAVPGIDWCSHVGGWLSGTLIGLALFASEWKTSKSCALVGCVPCLSRCCGDELLLNERRFYGKQRKCNSWLRWTCVLIHLVLFIVPLVALFTGGVCFDPAQMDYCAYASHQMRGKDYVCAAGGDATKSKAWTPTPAPTPKATSFAPPAGQICSWFYETEVCQDKVCCTGTGHPDKTCHLDPNKFAWDSDMWDWAKPA